MAIVKAGVGALRMDQLDLNFDGALSATSTNIHVAFSPHDYIDFGGSFTFNQFGQVSGTATSLTDTVNGRTHYSVTGMNADAQTLFGLVQSGDITGAEAYVLRDNDTITGRGADDYLMGFGGNDTIRAGAGIDTLVGGEGADKLDGGAGKDTFIYLSDEDSTVAPGGRDTILHFSHGDHDKIDLSAIDANENTARNERFSFVGSFTGHAGELIAKAVHGGFLVQGDTDGIHGADFSILVKTDVPLVAGDFTL